LDFEGFVKLETASRTSVQEDELDSAWIDEQFREDQGLVAETATVQIAFGTRPVLV
jgi:hypothetical protein